MKIAGSIAQKIGLGFLYGIGFGISAGGIYYVITEKMMASVWNDAAVQKVVVTKHEKVKRGESVHVLGTIENQGTESVRLINVQVDLFDKNETFVEQCAEYIKGSIRPGESINFKVTCGGCKDKPVVEHATYKVRIAGM
jgi:hypothetical protein